MLSAIVGINWGDEGKGRMVDLLAGEYDIVCRYQGGNNAGHTVVNDRGKFILNLLPSGILHPSTVNVMGNGMVIDIEHLNKEIASLRDKGVDISPDNLKISDRAIICMPYHKLLDELEEDRLADKKFGSTRRGIAPVYSDKYMKKGIRMGDLLHMDTLESKVRDIVEWKNLTVENGYHADPVDPAAIMAWLREFAQPLIPYICDVSVYLQDAAWREKKIMFEAQLGALRDIDFGIYPFTSSSSTIAAYAPIGAGIPSMQLDNVLGIIKAYSTCVGEGPFTAEMFGSEADALREAGGEYGAATGRPRRVGGFDCVASHYGVIMQGATELALTKLDVLSYLDRIPVVTSYELDGKELKSFPVGDDLLRARPLIKYLPGWKCDISECTDVSQLPESALDYIRFIEEATACPIKYVSVGPSREQYITMY